MFYHIVSYYIILYHIISYYIILYHIISYYIYFWLTYMNHLHPSHDPIDVDNDSSDIPMDVAVNISSRLFNENDQDVDLIVENMFAGVICYLLGGMPRAASYYTCLGCGERVTGTEFASYYTCLGCGERVTGTESDPASLTEVVDMVRVGSFSYIFTILIIRYLTF